MTALFLKYRPQVFADIVGQESVKKTLQNALKQENPAHAYMFAGSRGTGKTSTARIFAKGLNCPNLNGGDPCGKCSICMDTMNGDLVDVIEIDAASNRGIDEIRDLREKIVFAPNIAKRKVYIIDEVHMLSKEAFNALLKTLEEPPDHAYFCLATTEIHKIPETILSRCQVFLFGRFSLDQLVARLAFIAKAESIKFEESALKLIAQKAEGGLRDAISLLEQSGAESDGNLTEQSVQESLGLSSVESLDRFYKALLGKNTAESFAVIKELNAVGGDFRSFGHDFLSFCRERMFSELENSEQLPLIVNIINEMEKALMRLKTTPIIELPLEIAIINITKGVFGGTVMAGSSQVNAGSTVEGSAPAKKPVELIRKIATQATNDVSAKKSAEKPAAGLESSADIVFKAPKVSNEPVVAPVAAKGAVSEDEAVDSGMVGGGNLSQADLEASMKKIADVAGIPIFSKKSFITMEPKVVGNKITFYTDSNFHRDKLVNPVVLVPIKKAIAKLFDGNFSVDVEFNDNLRKKRSASPQEGNSAPANMGPEGLASADDFLTF